MSFVPGKPYFVPVHLQVLRSNFKHNKCNTSVFSPKQTHPQNAGSAGNKFVSSDKKLFGKIDTNRACIFLQQNFADELFIDSFVTKILF